MELYTKLFGDDYLRGIYRAEVLCLLRRQSPSAYPGWNVQCTGGALLLTYGRHRLLGPSSGVKGKVFLERGDRTFFLTLFGQVIAQINERLNFKSK
jgi:hypothetical protein